MTTPAAAALPVRATMSTEEQYMLAIGRKVMDSGRIPFAIVAEETGLDPLILRKLVRDGVLDGSAPYYKTVLEGSCDLAAARQFAQRLAAARRPVEGHGILATAAAEKYGFDRTSIYYWHKAGWVHVIDTLPNGYNLFNEGDIAFAAELVKISGHAQGKRVFPKKG